MSEKHDRHDWWHWSDEPLMRCNDCGGEVLGWKDGSLFCMECPNRFDPEDEEPTGDVSG